VLRFLRCLASSPIACSIRVAVTSRFGLIRFVDLSSTPAADLLILQMHWWFGRLTVLAAFVTIGFGIFAAGFDILLVYLLAGCGAVYLILYGGVRLLR
jgi:hypothetical protein